MTIAVMIAGTASGSTMAALRGDDWGLVFLASWTNFAVGNARALQRLERVSVRDWDLLTGFVTGAQSVGVRCKWW